MKTKTILYYFLILIIILGAFSSMAQNDYGLKIMGLASFVFCLSFLQESLNKFNKKKGKIISTWNFLEFISLGLLSFIFFLRTFFIKFNNIEWVFMLAGGMLIALYLLRAFQNFAITWKENRKLASITSAYYLSIVFYTFSMVVVVVQPSWSEPAGGIGFGLLLLFIAGVLLFNELYFAGEKYSAFQFLKRYVDKSVLVLVIYLLFTLYLGLTKFKLIPQMYSSEYPQGYIQLVNKAESGEEKPQDGKYKHEKFKESLDRFLERNSTADD